MKVRAVDLNPPQCLREVQGQDVGWGAVVMQPNGPPGAEGPVVPVEGQVKESATKRVVFDVT